MVTPPEGATWEDLPFDGAEPPSYETAAAVDDALSAAKAQWDHGEAPYDPDVLALIRAAEAMRAKLYGTVDGDPMPVFVIKGKDQLAPGAVDAYHDLCIEYGLPAQAREVWEAGQEIRRWQRRNPDRVQLPDHDHVPVTSAEPA